MIGTLGKPSALKYLTAVLIFLGAISAHAEDTVYLGGTPPGDEPLEVGILFNLVNITDVNEKEETIDIEGSIYLQWMDPRLAYDPADVGMTEQWTPGDYSRPPKKIYLGDFAVKEIFEGWRPHVVIPNGVGNRATTSMAVSIWPDGWVSYSETFYLKAETPMDLRRFPFDVQTLNIYFHPIIYQRHEILLIPDDRLSGTWDQNPGVADWSRESVTMSERPMQIAYSDDYKYEISELVVTIEIKRLPGHFLVGIIFPMILLVSLTWCVFWMDDETLSTRVNITFIGILSVVAYYFVILGSIPEVNYLTLIDAFIIATFLMLAADVVMSVAVESMPRVDRKRVDRVSRWAFPVAYAISTLFLAFLFLGL